MKQNDENKDAKVLSVEELEKVSGGRKPPINDK
jgi:bacteriocin-like protein